MNDRDRLSALALALLVVVSTMTAAIPASALSVANDGTTGDVSGNDTTTAVTTATTVPDNERATATTATTNETAATTTESQNRAAAGKPTNPKLSSAVSEAVSASTPDADGRTGPEFVRVVVEAKSGRGDAVAGLVGENGGNVQARHGALVQARVPKAAVSAFAESPAVSFVRKPRRPDTNEIVGEGLSNMDVGAVHDAGVSGDGVTVAVIDTGFDVTNPEIADHLVDWRNFSSPDPRRMSNRSGEHGTATAELVADTAPNASIIAVKVGTGVEFYEAIDWLEANTDTDVVTMSLSWYNAGPLDGTGPMNDRINASVANGTTWLSSAGNDGEGSHWNGTWRDADADGSLDFRDGKNRMEVTPADGSGSVSVYVSWNDWPKSHEDYDVYLVDGSGSILDQSTNVQDGTAAPTERVQTYVSDGERAYLRIESYDANGTADFDAFFRSSGDPEFATRARTVTVPATGRNVIAVGATHYSDNVLESFSSRGPTIDGRIKPDVVAPDGVTTSVYDSFYGTSASTPYTAGVVALMLSADDTLSPAQVKSRLRSTAVPLRGDEPNNLTGYGLVDADGAVPGVTETMPDTVTYSGNVSSSGHGVDDDTLGVYPTSAGTVTEQTVGANGNFSLTVASAREDYIVGYYQNDLDDGSKTRRAPKGHDGVADFGILGVVNGTSSSDLGARSLPTGHVLNVSVVDEEGDPIPNASVEVLRYADATTGYVDYEGLRTASNGTVVTNGSLGIEVEGRVRAVARAPEHSRYSGQNHTAIVDVTGDRSVTITLTDERVNLSGSVAEADGDPAADDEIRAYRLSGDGSAGTRTNATGAFSVTATETTDDYVVGYYQANASRHDETYMPDDGSPDIYALDIVNGSSSSDLGATRLPQAHDLNVTVVDESGDAVPFAKVTVQHHVSEGDRSGYISEGYFTERDGRITSGSTTGVEVAGPVTVKVTPPDGERAYADTEYVRNLNVTGDREVTVTLRSSVNLTGTVYHPDGSASADDFVRVESDDTRKWPYDETGATGAFAISRAVSGVAYNLTYYQDTFTDSPHPKDGTPDMYVLDRVNVTSDTDLGGYDLPVGHELDVRVVNESGVPVENASIDVSHHNDGGTARFIRVPTDAEGYMVPRATGRRGMEFAGDLTVEVSRPAGDERFVNRTYVRRLNLTSDAEIAVALGEPDQTEPSLSDFRLVADGQDVDVRLNTSEPLAELNVSLGGDVTGSLSRADFAETYRSGTFTYVADVSSGRDGSFDVTLDRVVDVEGTEATGGALLTLTVDTRGPDVSNFDATHLSNGTVAVTFDANESLSNVEVSLTGPESATLTEGDFTASGTTYNATYNFTSDGEYVATLTTVTDDKGNDGASGQSDTAVVDSHAPNVTVESVAEEKNDRAVADGDSVTVALAVTDGLSGVERVTLDASALGGGSVALSDSDDDGTYEGSFVVDASAVSDGTRSVFATATDAAGNGGDSLLVQELLLDTRAPNTTATFAGTLNASGWYTEAPELTLDATDATTAVVASEYRIDGGSWRTYDGPVALSEGTHTVEYRSTDEVGNVETAGRTTAKVDTVAPTTDVTLNGTEGDDGWYRSNVDVALDATDATSGVAATWYRINGSAYTGGTTGWQSYGEPPTVTEDGNYTVEFYSVDAAGNREVHGTTEFAIDTANPTVNEPESGLNRTDEILPERPVGVVVNAADDRGVAAVVVKHAVGTDSGTELAPGQQKNWTGPVPAFHRLGNHTFSVVVRDRAGNERVVETDEYSVGREATLRGTANGTLAAKVADANVEAVEIDTGDAATESANVTVGTSKKNPEANRFAPDGTSLYFPQINTTVPNADITNATVTVTVDEARVHRRFVKPRSVKFWVEETAGDGWDRVDATLVSQTDDTYTYRMDAPHFSTYAITGEKESAKPNVTAFGTKNATPTVGGVTLDATFSDGYSGVSAENVTLRLDGVVVTPASVTDSSVTFRDDLPAGTYDATLVVFDDAGNRREVTESFTVAEASVSTDPTGGGDSGGGGGGGGGGGSVPPPSVRVELRSVTDDHVTAKVTSARRGSPGKISPTNGLRGGAVTFENLVVTPKSVDATARFFVELRASADSPSGVGAPDGETLGYLTATPTYVTNADLDSVGMRFSVAESEVETPENVALYRYDAGSWNRLETTAVGREDGRYVLRADAAGVGAFAVGVERPAFEVADANLAETSVESGETVEVTATVENAGDGNGTYEARLTVDGRTVATKEVAVPAGESKTVTFARTFDAGQHAVAVGGVSAGTLSVGDGAATTTGGASSSGDGGEDGDVGGDGGVPGLGVATALVALFGALFAAVRRCD
ncbi:MULTISPECIES: S8 family serine peptidase [Halorussus]|uniref:S8 family serine peptidase n=1 Tax=Halorussus TaxID=1070314 RepID=UPI00209E3BB0|nr:S8 family serine peptidase [Halorussus vallis]USZ73998.1 S8 family serine peptidase [Halorussus vallis]